MFTSWDLWFMFNHLLYRKYEEIYPPEVSEFVYITDNTYDKDEVLRMENLMLKVLQFDLAVPTVNLFCEKYLKECEIPNDDVAYFLTMVSFAGHCTEVVV